MLVGYQHLREPTSTRKYYGKNYYLCCTILFVTYLTTLYKYEGAILFGISLVFVLFLLCPDVVATTSNQVEPVYDSNRKWQHCEAKYHFVFYVFMRLMFSLVFIYVIFTLIGRMP